jgi:uroporphyrinogen III methyltransferase/synthase
VAALRAEHGWFVDRPLFGTRVLVTRPTNQAESLVAQLTELGAGVLVQPAIEIGPPDDWAPVDRAVASLDRYDWLVFSSANGVQALLERLLAGGDLRALAGVKLAAIGPGTADELARYHLRADLVPDQYRAESLAEELLRHLGTTSRLLLARASRGREVLAEQLTAAGHEVEQIVVYASRDVTQADADVAELLGDGGIDWITVTSSAIARSLAAMFGDRLRKSKLATISPVTSATLSELGYEVAAEAGRYTITGLVEAIVAART